MNEEMQPYFQGLGYKDRFGPYEVPSNKVRKRLIDTGDILSAIGQEERRKTFCERRVCVLVFLHA